MLLSTLSDLHLPGKTYHTIGIVFVSSDPETKDLHNAFTELAQQAAHMGADAVINIQTQPCVATGGGISGAHSKVIITGTGIKIE